MTATVVAFVLVLLYGNHEGRQSEMGFFADAKACEAARAKVVEAVIADGAVEVGASCVKVEVNKVS